jgi:hypothetical protein
MKGFKLKIKKEQPNNIEQTAIQPNDDDHHQPPSSSETFKPFQKRSETSESFSWDEMSTTLLDPKTAITAPDADFSQPGLVVLSTSLPMGESKLMDQMVKSAQERQAFNELLRSKNMEHQISAIKGEVFVTDSYKKQLAKFTKQIKLEGETNTFTPIKTEKFESEAIQESLPKEQERNVDVVQISNESSSSSSDEEEDVLLQAKLYAAQQRAIQRFKIHSENSK